MRKLSFFISCCFAVLLLIGCEKEIDQKAEWIYPTENDAALKVLVASVYQRNPSFQISVNNTRVSTLIQARYPYPGGGFNTLGDNRPDFLVVKPGTANVSVAIPKFGTNVDSINIFTGTGTLAAGKHYSLHITDTAANTKMVLVEADVTRADTGSSKYRFTNLMPNVPAVDFYFGTTLVAGNVPYLGITPVITMKNPSASAAWTIREAGTAPTSTALATYTSTNTYLSTRNYVVFAQGYKGVGGTTDPRRPFVSFYLTK